MTTIIQLCDIEGPGTTLDYLNQRGESYQIIHLYRDHPLPRIDDVTRVIGQGCPLSATDIQPHDFLMRYFGFLSDVARRKIPFYGVCFSSQILAKLLGARVEPHTHKEIGGYKVMLTDEGAADPLFAGFDREFDVFHWHGDTFRIPFGLPLLVTSESCKNQAFRQDNMVGVQFHLETTAKDAATWCERYAAELEEIGKGKEAVLTEYNDIEARLRESNFKLLDNWFALG